MVASFYYILDIYILSQIIETIKINKPFKTRPFFLFTNHCQTDTCSKRLSEFSVTEHNFQSFGCYIYNFFPLCFVLLKCVCVFLSYL